MSNNEIREVLKTVHSVYEQFQPPISREKEELLHLLDAVLLRPEQMRTGRPEE